MTQMDGRTVLVTGGTGGIGKETARGLARLGARVVVVGRDARRAAEAAEELRHTTGNGQVHALTADLSRQRDVRRLAGEVAERHGELHVLLNNAGANPPSRILTEDGVETAFAVNVLAPYLLTTLLLPILRHSAPARVVNITGGVPRGRIDPANLQAERSFAGWLTDTQYNRSKLALMAMSRTFAELEPPGGVTVNVGYPGHAYTPMNKASGIGSYPVLARPIVPLLRVLMPRVWGDLEKPARNGIRLAADPTFEGLTGTYLDIKGRTAGWPATTADPDVRAAVWEACEKLTSGDRHPGTPG
ncbi:SDR family NAD(P)-dependent oxidoreductase [Streptosporangium soli]|nr:SDR family NAD(P)-dependent oxidoreductase [Streptosporangium sp. KLBMP 9127]